MARSRYNVILSFKGGRGLCLICGYYFKNVGRVYDKS